MLFKVDPDPDPDPGKDIEVDPDPDLDPGLGSKWIRIRIRPNVVDLGGSGSATLSLGMKKTDVYSLLLYSDRGSQLFWLVVYYGFLLKLKIDKQNRATTSKNVYQSKKVS